MIETRTIRAREFPQNLPTTDVQIETEDIFPNRGHFLPQSLTV